MEKISIIWYNELDSTQNEVQRRGETLDNLSVVAARSQTAGRGQRGNSWLSEPGMNLTASLLIRFGEGGIPSLDVRDYFRLNVAFSLAMTGYLASRGVPAEIKWPNDIFVHGRKICGVLIENVLAGTTVRSSVIGFGLNLNQTDFPSLANATSVRCQTGAVSDPETELQVLAERIVQSILDSFSEPEKQRDAYQQLLFRKGVLRSFRDLSSGAVFEACLQGVDEQGRVVLLTPEGLERRFAFKEVGYIL